MDKCSIALGTFDGLHAGHMAVLDRVQQESDRPVALTFAFPPRLYGTNDDLELLITPEEKKQRLTAMGIRCEILHFEKIKDLSAEEFLMDMIERFHPSLIVSGFNFRFGKDAKGDTAALCSFCAAHGIRYENISPVLWQDAPVSSTRIRTAIKNGQIDDAENMLGRCFGFENPVIHGDERGRTIGFPTINQVYPAQLVVPRFGVYASRTEIDGVCYDSVTNIGRRPTFATDYIISETHLFDYSGDAYGKMARVSLTGFIRDEVRFETLEQLKQAIRRDKQTACGMRILR